MHPRIRVQHFSRILMTQGNTTPAVNIFKSFTSPFQPELSLASLWVLTHSINRIPRLKENVGGGARAYFWTSSTRSPLVTLQTGGWRQAGCVGEGGIREHNVCTLLWFFPLPKMTVRGCERDFNENSGESHTETFRSGGTRMYMTLTHIFAVNFGGKAP